MVVVVGGGVGGGGSNRPVGVNAMRLHTRHVMLSSAHGKSLAMAVVR